MGFEGSAMPRKTSIPRYSLHKASGQGRIRFQGRDIYFGPYDAPESHERYARFVAELSQHPTGPSGESDFARVADPDLLVCELILRYLRFAREYYGPKSREPIGLRAALRPVNELYGNERARNFGPLALKAVRKKLLDQDICRTEINRRVSRIKRAFKWAVSEQMIPASVFEGLRSVDGLRQGRSAARESAPVRPVDIHLVEETIKFLSPPVAAICRLQLLTGMRPSEVVQMRPMDLDRSGDIWIYHPSSHKTQYLGIDKQIPLGPQAQAVITPFLDRSPAAYLFTPEEAERWRQEQRNSPNSSNRKTPIYPSEMKSRQKRKRDSQSRKRNRPFHACYRVVSYRRAICYALAKAKRAGHEIPHWFPYQLRHTHGTTVRKKYGLEAAQVSLGHSSADVTQVYAERNLALAVEVASQMG